MANYKTGAQRYNDRMSKIFETAKKNTNNWGSGFGYASKETNKTLAKHKALQKKKGYKIEDKPKKLSKEATQARDNLLYQHHEMY